MSRDLETMLREARPPLDAPPAAETRVAAAVVGRRGGVAPAAWRSARLPRVGRALVVAILVAAAGTAIAASVISLRTRAPAPVVAAQGPTDWSRAEILSDPIRFAHPAASVAVSDDGHAVAAWERAGRVEMRLRPPGGPWAPVVVASAGAQFATNPVVALSPDGVGAILWRERRGGREIVLRLRGPGGRRVGTFRRRVGVEFVIMSRSLNVRTGRLGLPAVVSKPTIRQGDLRELAAGADAAGRVSAAWDRAGRIEAATLAPDRVWSDPLALAQPEAGRPVRLALAVDRSGRSALVWISIGPYDPATAPGSQITVTAAATGPDGRWETPRVVGHGATNTSAPVAAITPDRRVVIAWTGFVARADPPFPGVVSAAVRGPNGDWGTPTALSPEGRSSGAANLAVDGAGDVVAVWTQTREGHDSFSGGPRTTTQASVLSAGGWSAPTAISRSGVTMFGRGRVPIAEDGSGRVVALLPDGLGVVARTWTPDAHVRTLQRPTRVLVTPTAWWFVGIRGTFAAGRDGTAVAVAFRPGVDSGRVVAFVREPRGR